MECQVCFHNFDSNNRRPRTLPCKHSYCTACLQKILHGRNLKCPRCKVSHSIENIDAVPVTYIFDDIAASPRSAIVCGGKKSFNDSHTAFDKLEHNKKMSISDKMNCNTNSNSSDSLETNDRYFSKMSSGVSISSLNSKIAELKASSSYLYEGRSLDTCVRAMTSMSEPATITKPKFVEDISTYQSQTTSGNSTLERDIRKSGALVTSSSNSEPTVINMEKVKSQNSRKMSDFDHPKHNFLLSPSYSSIPSRINTPSINTDPGVRTYSSLSHTPDMMNSTCLETESTITNDAVFDDEPNSVLSHYMLVPSSASMSSLSIDSDHSVMIPQCIQIEDLCTEHKFECNFYCKTHSQWVCRDCTVIEHKLENCNIISKKQAVEGLRTREIEAIDAEQNARRELVKKLENYTSKLQFKETLRKDLRRRLVKLMQDNQEELHSLQEVQGNLNQVLVETRDKPCILDAAKKMIQAAEGRKSIIKATEEVMPLISSAKEWRAVQELKSTAVQSKNWEVKIDLVELEESSAKNKELENQVKSLEQRASELELQVIQLSKKLEEEQTLRRKAQEQLQALQSQQYTEHDTKESLQYQMKNLETERAVLKLLRKTYN
ncbi:unnamed protein product [Meganyctiphanes norvegica]|uniref:RING-type domain-containing protein n=1 Tax=Meganyctiphanes norvegica TaxID=48144 RepID=A0AAV2QHR3_MEGNR